MPRRHTKIVATIGPACDQTGVLEKMLDAGMNLARLNFSHGIHADHLARIEDLRALSEKKQQVLGIIADLQGPKIRIANFKSGKVTLQKGQRFVLDVARAPDDGDESGVGVLFPDLIHDVKPGHTLLLDDGRMRLLVQEVVGSEMITRVENDGELANCKGINLLGGGLSAKALTDKDREDLAFALSQEVDYVALSFVRHAEDIREAQKLIAAAGKSAGVIAKIERAEALDHIEEIIAAADAIMIARGDLAIEIGEAKVPLVQKEVIHQCRAMDKPVIIATQMMESMVHSPVPTRAEVSDVANAVLDNADAVMLSEETAMGDHPHVVIEAMARACFAAGTYHRSQVSHHRMDCQFDRIDEAIAMATMYTANHFDVKAIVALTESGATPLWMSRIRTAIPIYALSRHEKALRRMSLYRAVFPLSFDVTKCSRDEVNRAAVDCAALYSGLSKGQRVILTKGDHLGVGGGANAMKIVEVGNVV